MLHLPTQICMHSTSLAAQLRLLITLRRVAFSRVGGWMHMPSRLSGLIVGVCCCLQAVPLHPGVDACVGVCVALPDSHESGLGVGALNCKACAAHEPP